MVEPLGRVACPKCGHSFSLELRCNRCEHRWWPKTPEVPKVCPSCKSPYWNRARQRKAPPKSR